MNMKIIKRRESETQEDFELRVDALLADVGFLSFSFQTDENGESKEVKVLYL